LILIVCLLVGLALAATDKADRIVLFDGSGLEKWESIGDGLWTITSEGYLLGQRDPRKPPVERPWFNDLKGDLNRSWFETDFKVMMGQAWLYTKQDFDEYDLHIEWWVPTPGNSGISIGDKTRARYTFGDASDLAKTPSQIAYEIQISAEWGDDYTSGSLYSIIVAKPGHQKSDDWNAFDIEVRKDTIRVGLNGQVVTEHNALPDRPTDGPVGLQLHDEGSIVMFRNIWLRDVSGPATGQQSD
jgi:hypothetical protein